MVRIRGYKYRAYPDSRQKDFFQKNFGCCRFVYNHYLSEKKRIWNEEHRTMSRSDMSRDLAGLLKKENPWLKEADSIALQQVLRHLDKAYQGFFSGKNGYPRYKSRRSDQSYRSMNVNGNIRVCGNLIKIPKAGMVKIVNTRDISGRIISATVSRKASGRYYISLQVEEEYGILPNRGGQTGIDLGLKSLYTDSSGKTEENTRIMRGHEKKLRRLQKGVSRKRPGSKNRDKARKKLAREHERVADIRNDWQHKITHRLASENQVVCMEDLNVRGMMRNHRLAGGIADVSWSEFARKLEYKMKDHGGILVKVPRIYPSSQLCSNCGWKNPRVKDLRIRNWICPVCGARHDRDLNAAINILKKGLELLVA